MLMKGGDEDQDVIEATAALKGMLGIGGLLAQQEEGSTAPAAVEGQKSQAEGGPSPTAKTKQSKKKKKGEAKASEGQEGAKPVEPPAVQQEAASATAAAVATDESSKPNRPNPAPKKKKNKKSANKKNNESENYAWSAFQSSPDASKLPIPEFSSPVSREKDRVSPNLAKTTVPVQLNPPEAEDSEERAPERASGREQSATNGGLTSLDEPQSDSKGEHELLQSSSSGDAAAADEIAASEATPPPVSETGINLAAALAGSPPHDPAPDAKAQYSQQPPVPPYQQMSHHQNPPPYGPGHGMPPPQMYPYPPAPRYPMPPPGSPNFHHANMQGPPPPPPPPPGYVTIQVQVPPVLMPGRNMIVTSPSGYPVQVAVPEGIPPGMIIPVHVPAGPPMHLMPPPHPSSYGRY